MKHEALTQKIIGVFYDVYNELGGGFLESVYRKAMMIALAEAGLTAEEEKPLTVWFRSHPIGQFYADIVVESLVILEIKGCRALEPAHEAQLLNYLRATDIEIGFLLNIGPKPEFKRMIFDNDRKSRRG